MNTIRPYGSISKQEFLSQLEHSSSVVSDSTYTSEINSVSTNRDYIPEVDYVGAKDNALVIANSARTSIEGLLDRISAMHSLLSTYYDSVQEKGTDIEGNVSALFEVLTSINKSIIGLCDVLNGVGTYEGSIITSDLIDAACASLDDAQAASDQYVSDYFLDENGNVDSEAIGSVYAAIENCKDTAGADLIAESYADFCVDYLSRDDLTDEQLDSLVDANLEYGMIQDRLSEAPEPELITVDGEEYYVVYFPYVASDSLKLINGKIHNKVLTMNGDKTDGEVMQDLLVVSAYLNIYDVVALDKIGIPQLIPYADVQALTDIYDSRFPLDYYFDAPPFPDIVDVTSQGGLYNVSITSPLPDSCEAFKVVLFSTSSSYGFDSMGTFPFVYDIDHFVIDPCRPNPYKGVADRLWNYIAESTGKSVWDLVDSILDGGGTFYDIVDFLCECVKDWDCWETLGDFFSVVGVATFLVDIVLDDINYNITWDMLTEEERQIRLEKLDDYFNFSGANITIYPSEDSINDSFNLDPSYTKNGLYYDQQKNVVLDYYHKYLANLYDCSDYYTYLTNLKMGLLPHRDPVDDREFYRAFRDLAQDCGYDWNNMTDSEYEAVYNRLLEMIYKN